jgi:hypothetical protein
MLVKEYSFFNPSSPTKFLQILCGLLLENLFIPVLELHSVLHLCLVHFACRRRTTDVKKSIKLAFIFRQVTRSRVAATATASTATNFATSTAAAAATTTTTIATG